MSALAAILGCTRSTIRHFAERLGFRYTVCSIGPRHKRTACLTPDQANAIATEVERETAAYVSASSSSSSSPSTLPLAENEEQSTRNEELPPSHPLIHSSNNPRSLGHFYLLQLEPQHDPGRFKLGFTTDVARRLDDLLTVVPLARLIATWPCHRSWERIAIISTAQNAEQISQEVFRCTHLEEAVAAAHRFFAVMPKPETSPPRAWADPARTEVISHPRRGAAESGSAEVAVGNNGGRRAGEPALRRGGGGESGLSAGGRAGDPAQSAKHHFNPSAPPTEAPPLPGACDPSASDPPQGRDAAPPASHASRCGKAAGGAEQNRAPHQNLLPHQQAAADPRGAPQTYALNLPPAYAHLLTPS